MYQIKEPPEIVKEYYKTITSSHEIQIRVTLLNNKEEVAGSFTYPQSFILSGDIEVDITRNGPTRLLNLEMLNEDDSWFFNLYSPASSSFWFTNFIKVEYGVFVPSKNDYVWVPIGVFVIQRVSIKGDVISISGADKAARFIDPYRTINAYNKIKKGWRVSIAIETFLRDYGETKFKFTATSKRVNADLSFPPGTEIWPEVLKLARSADLALFYDGDGYCTLRPKTPDAPVYVYKIGDEQEDSTILDSPRIDFDISQIRNWVHVKGGGTIAAVAVAPRSHPFSPWNLDPDKPLYLPHFHENPYIDRKKYAQNAANSLLSQLLQAGTNITFDSLVIPTLEEYDFVKIEDKKNRISQKMILDKFNIPLSVDRSQKIGSSFSKGFK